MRHRFAAGSNEFDSGCNERTVAVSCPCRASNEFNEELNEFNAQGNEFNPRINEFHPAMNEFTAGVSSLDSTVSSLDAAMNSRTGVGRSLLSGRIGFDGWVGSDTRASGEAPGVCGCCECREGQVIAGDLLQGPVRIFVYEA
jgi:hypothetical protein